jgi:hypothetical protein
MCPKKIIQYTVNEIVRSFICLSPFSQCSVNKILVKIRFISNYDILSLANPSTSDCNILIVTFMPRNNLNHDHSLIRFVVILNDNIRNGEI